MRIKMAIALLLFLYVGVPGHAGEVEIAMATFTQRTDVWDVQVTLRHADTGWEHYADAWRIVTEDGKTIGTRTLYHPHVDEQPFTRGLQAVTIPSHVSIVFVEAHDKVHGWGPDRLQVDLRKRTGERYRVTR
ncbi:MAG: hypothetical protein ACE5K1_12190 [Acidiferrobacterales bacterium]